MIIINPALIKNPVNWFTVLLMLVLFGIAADFIFRRVFGVVPTAQRDSAVIVNS